jgi:hypothetical protein
MKIDAATWCAERDALLRSLNVEKFQAFWERHKMPVPKGGWASPEVPLIMMHKCRLEVNAMTAEEKAVSREWLRERGYAGFHGLPL